MVLMRWLSVSIMLPTSHLVLRFLLRTVACLARQMKSDNGELMPPKQLKILAHCTC